MKVCGCVNPSPNCMACRPYYMPYPNDNFNYILKDEQFIKYLKNQIENLLNENLKLKQDIFMKDVEINKLKNDLDKLSNKAPDVASEINNLLNEVAKKFNIKIDKF